MAASVTFLDGNATAASQMQSRLSSDSPEVVQGIFPESTFGPVIMSAVNQTNVTNPSKSSGRIPLLHSMGAGFAACPTWGRHLQDRRLPAALPLVVVVVAKVP